MFSILNQETKREIDDLVVDRSLNALPYYKLVSPRYQASDWSRCRSPPIRGLLSRSNRRRRSTLTTQFLLWLRCHVLLQLLLTRTHFRRCIDQCYNYCDCCSPNNSIMTTKITQNCLCGNMIRCVVICPLILFCLIQGIKSLFQIFISEFIILLLF